MRKSTKKREENLLDKPLEEILRHGAQEMLKFAVIEEVEEVIDNHKELKDELGHRRIIRNGYHKSRRIIWPGGTVEIEVPRARDKENEIIYESSIIPRYLRRSKNLDEFIPYLYLKGISTGDFSEVLSKLLGREASLSSATVVRLKDTWMDEYESWNKRDLRREYAV